MRVATKVVKTHQLVTVREVTEKYFTAAKKKRQVCKDIIKLCVYAEKSGFVKKPLKIVWCGLDTYFVCRVCLDYNKKPIPLHLNTIQGTGVGKQ